MKCHILFSVKNTKNNSNLSSAELAQGMVKSNTVRDADFPAVTLMYREANLTLRRIIIGK